MPRIFVVDGREFPDPDPNLKVDEVRQSMSVFFPELSNAETLKEKKRGEDTIFEFKRRVGTKGITDEPEVIVDEVTFNMVDGMLARQGNHDDRPAAVDLLETGVQNGTLGDTARVIAQRYSLRPEVIIGWYAEVLKRRVKEITKQIEELTEARIDYAGSR